MVEEQRPDPMNDDPTPINARPKRRPQEALEGLSLALRDRLIWPLEDRFVTLSDKGRAAVAGGAVVLALGIGIGGFALVSSDGGTEPTSAPQVAVAVEPAPQPAPAEPKPEPVPTLKGAAPVLKAPDSSKVTGSKPADSGAPAATAGNSGSAATDTISSNPSAQPAGASASASAATVDGPPAGPAAIAVARKFAGAFVVYETGGGEESAVRKAFTATATPEVTKALMQRPPRQPQTVEVPKAKVLNVVPAPSHDRIYPVSVSLLRVGSTSELRLEMKQLKNKQWRVVNVLG